MIGPIQFLVVGFESNDKFRGEILKELDELRVRGTIRLLDLLFVMKDTNGEIMAFEETDLSAEEEAEYGAMIKAMMGLGAGQGSDEAIASAVAMSDHDYGITAEDVLQVADQIDSGTSAGILLIEHRWAIGLKTAIRNAGGHPLMQGFLTPEALFMVGKELEAIVEAEAAIEMAEAVKGAAMLEMLATVATAEAIEEAAIEEAVEVVAEAEVIKMMAAAEAARALIVAGLIEEAAAQEAIDALVVAGLIEQAAVEEAADAVAQAEAVVAAAWSAAEDADDIDTASVAEIA